MTFSFFALISVLFCIFLFYLGKREVKKAETYAENERFYMVNLLECIYALNSMENTMSARANMKNVLGEVDAVFCIDLKKCAYKLRREINNLQRNCGERKENSDSYETLQEKAQLLSSVAGVMLGDLEEDNSEKITLLKDDLQILCSTLIESKGILEKLLNAELAHSEIWQRQSLYFYKRLQFLLVVFFILTSAFSVSASFLFGFILKHSLKEMRTGTGEISSGNLKYRFRDIQNDEIGSLMYDFNLMARRLEKQTEALKKANMELTEKAELLIDANRHKDRFLANMSHELRTPLNAIIGFSELIASKVTHDEKLSSHARRILVAAEHLLELISGLLEVAKADAGVISPVLKSFNLSETLKSVFAIMQPLAENRKLQLIEDIPENCILYSDEKFIRQITINLMNNAIKFTHLGSVLISLRRSEKHYHISVTDTGIGISEIDKKHIFKDFHRLESGLTSNYEGVGLGLTLSKKLAELIKSEISLDSEEGKGSTFTLIVPASALGHSFEAVGLESSNVK